MNLEQLKNKLNPKIGKPTTGAAALLLLMASLAAPINGSAYELAPPALEGNFDAKDILQDFCDSLTESARVAERATLCDNLDSEANWNTALQNRCIEYAEIYGTTYKGNSLLSCIGGLPPGLIDGGNIDPQHLPVGRTVDAQGGGGGGGATVGFAAACYWSDIAIAVVYLAVGCAAAATFTSQVSWSSSFLIWDWDFDLGAGFAACGAGAVGNLGLSPATGCTGHTTTGTKTTFACTDNGPLISNYAIGCAEAGASVGTTTCAEASASAHASNNAAIGEAVDVSITGTSGGCDAGTSAILLGAMRNMASRNAGPETRMFHSSELPEGTLEMVREDLVGQLYDRLDADIELRQPSILEELYLISMAGQLEEQINQFEFPEYMEGTKKTTEDEA